MPQYTLYCTVADNHVEISLKGQAHLASQCELLRELLRKGMHNVSSGASTQHLNESSCSRAQGITLTTTTRIESSKSGMTSVMR